MNALEVGQQSASKPLRPFGSASIKRPVSEAIAKANAEDRKVIDGSVLG